MPCYRRAGTVSEGRARRNESAVCLAGANKRAAEEIDRTFLCDGMLGRLARWLRLLGYDAIYFNTPFKKEFIEKARAEERIILSKCIRLDEVKRAKVFIIHTESIIEQLKEVIKGLRLKLDDRAFFSRCSFCNLPLKKIEGEKIKEKVPSSIYRTMAKFTACNNCQRIFWQGSHWQRMKEKLERLNIQ